jgi:hypothetical protein
MGNCTGPRNAQNGAGNGNTGYWNTGHRNTGDRNTGDRNTGDWNTGHRNTGNRNTGNRNTGDWNTGNRNTGNWNTGNWNTGNWNTGDWNVCDNETGHFNTEQSDKIRVFNKDCDREIWNNADKPNFLYFIITEWVDASHMTDTEKEAEPNFETLGGYLKSYEYKDAFKKSWDNAEEEDRAKLFKLPNFDADVFFEISGIDVREAKQEPERVDDTIVLNGVTYKRVD